MPHACHQAEQGCEGSSNCKCYACGSGVCKSCSRLLRDRYSKGAYRRICLDCAQDQPERFGFRPKLADKRAWPVDAAFYWNATHPESKVSPKRVLALKYGAEVALALMGEDVDVGGNAPFVEPPYRRFK